MFKAHICNSITIQTAYEPIIFFNQNKTNVSMRAFLLLLLSAVAVIILWAIRSKSYENDLVFALSTLAAGLCAYLLADYFFSVEKKSLKQEIVEAKKEIQVWKDEKDLLQTQFNLATPHAQVEQLEQQLAFADEQRNKLDGLSRAQYAEISGLKTQLEMQKKNYQKLYEESAIATETRNAELMALQDSLASKREKIKYLTDESEYLRGKILKLQTVAEEETIQKVVAESRDVPPANLPKVVIKMPQNGVNTEGYVQQDFAAKTIDNQVLDTEVVAEKDAEPIVENKATEVETAVENKATDAEPIVENKAIEAETVVENTERTLDSQPVATPNSENLQAIQGIDAEMERVLKSAGIDNWQEISETSAERLKEILAEGKIGNVDTSSWSVQAILLIDGHVNRLKTYLANLEK